MKFIQISKEYIIFVNTYVYKNVLVNILHSSVALIGQPIVVY